MVSLATVDQPLLATWDELGLTDDERKSELDRLNGLLQQVQSVQVESVRQEHLTLKAKINETCDSHIQFLVLLGGDGAAESIANVKTLSLTGIVRARLAEVEAAFDTVLPEDEHRLREFESLCSRIEGLAATLEIADPERADRLDFDRTALSQADRKRLTGRLRRLEREAAVRSDRFRELSEKINARAEELGEVIEPEFVEFLASVKITHFYRYPWVISISVTYLDIGAYIELMIYIDISLTYKGSRTATFPLRKAHFTKRGYSIAAHSLLSEQQFLRAITGSCRGRKQFRFRTRRVVILRLMRRS
jgi:hypothetical protein